jgi:glutamate-1-semialdehyde 2,1-aminomutase
MVLHYGTFNGHRLTMKVIAANLDLLAAPGVYPALHATGDAAIRGLRDVFHRHGIKAIVQGFGPMFQIYFTDRDRIAHYRDYCEFVDSARYSRFVQGLQDRGIYMTPSNGLHWIISTAHQASDIETLLEAADQVCRDLA